MLVGDKLVYLQAIKIWPCLCNFIFISFLQFQFRNLVFKKAPVQVQKYLSRNYYDTVCNNRKLDRAGGLLPKLRYLLTLHVMLL